MSSWSRMLPWMVGGAFAAGMWVGRAKAQSRTSRTGPTSSAAHSTPLPADLDLTAEFKSAFPRLVQEFLVHVEKKYGMSPASVQRLKEMMFYNCEGGKMYRGNLVVTSTKAICEERNLVFSRELLDQAIVLGWCIEVLQAYFLVADDIMDKSLTRRGKKCWYLVDTVQYDAVNDSLLLESFIFFMLKMYFDKSPHYLQLLELFNEVSLRTQLGQMMDLVSQPQGRKVDNMLDTFSAELHQKIVDYKTAFYTFWLPLASGMIICGLNSKEELDIAEKVSLELGRKFQIQDDYLDCYGDPKLIGKIGTDIQDHKCSWLVVQALKRVNAQQRKILEQHYGKDDEKSVEQIKELFRELELSKVYDAQEEESLQRINALIKQHSDKVPAAIFTGILKKIHNRQK